jgi:hypothetical protein
MYEEFDGRTRTKIVRDADGIARRKAQRDIRRRPSPPMLLSPSPGGSSRPYSKDVAPDRSTLRIVFQETFRPRAISLIVLPSMKCPRRIRPIVSTVRISPSHLRSKRAAHQPNLQGAILDADPPAHEVKIARRQALIDTPRRRRLNLALVSTVA